MGERITFQCNGCGYGALVSGGLDAGECVCTQTIYCLDCNELMDVVSAVQKGFEEPGMELTDEAEESLLIVRIRCERDPNHQWRKWNFPDVCPRCRASMTRSHGLRMLWDWTYC